MLALATQRAYTIVVADDEGRVCRDIPEELCDEQPHNFFSHVVSLTATKTGDGLADPKLVLAWLLGALGAPAWQIGLLVPVREAGSLLPQLATAAWIRSRRLRKRVWALASVGQGIAVGGMAASALLLDGAVAGAAVLTWLLVFALARSAASVSYNDVLGKTVSKATRGKALGTAGSAASALVLTFGVLISTGIIPLTIPSIAVVLATASGLWLVAAITFMTLAERPGATGGARRPLDVAWNQLGLLRTDRQLQRFIIVRGLLVATALAPPYILALASSSGAATPGMDGAEANRIGALGPFVIASAAASVSSAWLWGRLADRSSRQTLAAASFIAFVTLGALAMAARWAPGILAFPAVLPFGLFVLMLAYQGVRIGRATHVVDMAEADTRAAYTALSNTAIGLLLLLASGFGALAHVVGLWAVLGAFSVMCAFAAVASLSLDEVQRE